MTQFSKNKRLRIYRKYNEHCAYCGVDLLYSQMEIDHIIPISNFNNTLFDNQNIPVFLKHLNECDVNHDDNLNPSCRKCNRFKSSFHLGLFRIELQKQVERAEKTSSNFRFSLMYGLIKKTNKQITFYFENQIKQ